MGVIDTRLARYEHVLECGSLRTLRSHVGSFLRCVSKYLFASPQERDGTSCLSLFLGVKMYRLEFKKSRTKSHYFDSTLHRWISNSDGFLNVVIAVINALLCSFFVEY